MRSSIARRFTGERIHQLIERRVERPHLDGFVLGVEPALSLLGRRAGAHVRDEARERPEHRPRDERRAERGDQARRTRRRR